MRGKVRKTDAQLQSEKRTEIMSFVQKSCAYYRENPHRFVRDYFHYELVPHEEIVLNAMFRYANACYFASRGLGKSMITAIFAAAYCILYPGTDVKVASCKRSQAQEIIEKIINILKPKSLGLEAEIEDWKNQSGRGVYQVQKRVHDHGRHLGRIRAA